MRAQLAHNEAKELVSMLQDRSARVLQLEACLASLGAPARGLEGGRTGSGAHCRVASSDRASDSRE